MVVVTSLKLFERSKSQVEVRSEDVFEMNLIQSFSLIALFVSSFIWNNGDVYIQLAYNGYAWQTLIIACLCFISIVNLYGSLSQLGGTNIFQEYSKFKV